MDIDNNNLDPAVKPRDDGYGERILSWAKQQPVITALIQIGSRVQSNSRADQWSDWDYHLVCKNVNAYLNYPWQTVFGNDVWASFARKTNRNAIKLSLILKDAAQVDFVLLTDWQLKLLYFLMKRPALFPFLPSIIKKALGDLQMIAKPGYQVLIGGKEWEDRLAALQVKLPPASDLQTTFSDTVAEFWQHATLTFKQLARGNYRAAQRNFHLQLRECSYALLMLSAKTNGKQPVHEARYAEEWLTESQLDQTSYPTAPEKKMLLLALMREITFFDELSKEIALQDKLRKEDFTPLKTWLLTQCELLLRG